MKHSVSHGHQSRLTCSVAKCVSGYRHGRRVEEPCLRASSALQLQTWRLQSLLQRAVVFLHAASLPCLGIRSESTPPCQCAHHSSRTGPVLPLSLVTNWFPLSFLNFLISKGRPPLLLNAQNKVCPCSTPVLLHGWGNTRAPPVIPQESPNIQRPPAPPHPSPSNSPGAPAEADPGQAPLPTAPRPSVCDLGGEPKFRTHPLAGPKRTPVASLVKT